MSGRSLTDKAWRIVSAETCEMSTIMPIRFISRTTSSPKFVRPPCLASSVAESAQSIVSAWVRVM